MSHATQPQDLGFSPERLESACQFLADAVDEGETPAAALQVARFGTALAPRVFGRQYLQADSPPIRSDTIFLVASITKPVTAAAVMLLVERGKIMLDQRVSTILPEFGSHDKHDVRIRHLLTHTSGLPDFLAENQQLREEHAPLSEFIHRIYKLKLDFPPGTDIQYQSSGVGVLGAIVEQVEQMPLPEFLHHEIFVPLGMVDTALGVRHLPQDRIAHVNVGPEMQETDWGWNTPYWRNFAAPWGGLFTTTSDMLRFCQLFLNGGEFNGARILGPATVRTMTRNQTGDMVDIPITVRSQQTWGLGWALAGRRHPVSGWSYFGDLVSPESYGHTGATGTLVWVDPTTEVVCILFTTESTAFRRGLLYRCSNMVASAVL